jgi:hypothetical protein
LRRFEISASTISRLRSGEKRQSVVNEAIRNWACVWPARGQVAAVLARRVEVVERLGDQQVGVGVEVFGELVALVAQVGLDLEVDAEVEFVVVGFGRVAQLAAEFFGHVVVRQVGDVADHARHLQAVLRHHAMCS